MEKPSKKLSTTIIKTSIFPVIMLLLVICLLLFFKTIIAPTISLRLYQFLDKIISTVLTICFVFIIQRIVGAAIGWYKMNIAEKTDTHLDDELIPFLSRTVNVAIWTVAIMIILPFYGINISGLIAVFGVSSLAISLAAQDTIANIISGFLIMVDRPFKVGDEIKLPSGQKVEVLNIGIRRSRFLSEDKGVVIVPNLNLSKSSIVNYTYTNDTQPKA